MKRYVVELYRTLLWIVYYRSAGLLCRTYNVCFSCLKSEEFEEEHL